MLLKAEVPLEADETGGSLHDKLSTPVSYTHLCAADIHQIINDEKKKAVYCEGLIGELSEGLSVYKKGE